MIRDFSGLIGQGKFREKLCFIGGETDRVKHSHENLSWCLLCLVLVNPLVDNQKDMILLQQPVLHLVQQVFHTHNFGDHIGAILAKSSPCLQSSTQLHQMSFGSTLYCGYKIPKADGARDLAAISWLTIPHLSFWLKIQIQGVPDSSGLILSKKVESWKCFAFHSPLKIVGLKIKSYYQTLPFWWKSNQE